ncbi:MAG: alanine racemase [Lachnospiraceae bacterium]|nr:alanine racemase [Lachnospiraceae bacterium]
MKKYRRVHADIDLDAVLFNFEQMSKNIPDGTQIMAVVKTDAYGHGAVPLASLIEPLEYLWGFATATVDEAVELRQAGIKKPILILGYSFPECYPQIIEYDIRQTVFAYEMAEELSKEAVRQNKKAYIHIKLDTGMGRIGYQNAECAAQDVAKMKQLPMIEMEGVFTHFANADTENKDYTLKQIEKFKEMITAMENTRVTFALKHCANSAGIIELSDCEFNLVRAGIISYGMWPSDEVKKNVVQLKPILSLKSHVVYVKEVEPGTSVSYGSTWTAGEKRRIATIPVGYGDGYPRSLSNKGYVLIKGCKAPIVGRVCMDQLMVDVTDVPEEVHTGDRVTLIGQDGEYTISAEELGDLSGRFNYELMCDLGNRIARIYYKDGKIKEIRDYFEK